MKQDNLQSLSQHLICSDDWLTAEALASFLHKSTRTIRSYIYEINQQNPSEPLIISSSEGYRWNHNVQSAPQQNLNDCRSNPPTPKYRILFWIRKLLILKKINEFNLTEQLYISDSTGANDLLKVNTIVSTFGIRLVRHNENIMLQGSEFDMRRLSMYCILKTIHTQSPFFSHVSEAFPEFNMEDIKKIVTNAMARNNININGYLFNQILIHIGICLIRNKCGKSIKNEDIPNVNLKFQQSEYNAATEIRNELNKRLNILLPEIEASYISLSLISDTNPQINNKISKLNEVSLQILLTCKEILKNISSFYDIDLNDEEFVIQISLFFQKSIVRFHTGLQIYNPIADSIRVNQPFLYDIALEIYNQISHVYPLDFSQADVSFLTLQLATFLDKSEKSHDLLTCIIICPEYYNSHTLLVEKLIQNFADKLIIVKVIKSLNSETFPYDVDLIITVLPIPDMTKAVLISPILHDKDFINIYLKIKQLRFKQKMIKTISFMQQHLTEKNFEINHYFKDEQEAIKYITDYLEKNSNINTDFKNSVLTRENMDSTAMYNLVAIPHSTNQYAIKSNIYIIANQKPMPYKESAVNYIIFIALSKKDKKYLKYLYPALLEVFSDVPLAKQLLTVSNHKEFIEKLSKSYK